MQNILKEKMWAYIVHHNPDLMISLQNDFSVTQYLEEKVNGVLPLVEKLQAEGRPLYAIEELCLEEMTKQLKPSKFLYIRSVLEEEFEDHYYRLKENGTLTSEIIDVINACKDCFESFEFSVETENNRHLRYAIIEQIHNHIH